MGNLEIVLLAVGLSMDAFAVAICKGLALSHNKISSALTVGLWFGVFQALMPLIGYLLGVQFMSLIQSFDHWIAFVLLAVIGGNMIREVFSEKEDEHDASLKVYTMFPLAVATSIDALASGIAMAAIGVEIIPTSLLIGSITFVLSAIAVIFGAKLGARFKTRAEIAGGVMLILIALKIVIEHLFEGI